MNVLIRRLTDCEFRTEPKGFRANGQPKTNGFFLVGRKGTSGSWGTCFLRIISHKSQKPRNQIDLTYNTDPTFFHTYTKIPQDIAHNVFHVYVNYKEGNCVSINLAPGDRIIGFDTPQPSGEYLNRSFLIYSPSEVEPTVGTMPFGCVAETFYIQQGEEREPFQFQIGNMFKGRKIQKIFLNEEGYPRKLVFSF